METYDVTGIMIRNSWKQIGSAKYYFDDGGNMVTGEYIIDDMVYYFGTNGKWVTTEETVFYSGTKFLLKDGKFLKNSWKQIDGTWYYFGPDGNAWTGTRVINGKTYYLTTPKNKYVELG